VIRQILLLVGSCALLVVGAAQSGKPGIPASKPSVEREIDFNRDVRPILSNSCFKCHGPDAATVAAGLRLDTFEGATKDRNGRRGIVPGNPAESRIFARVAHEDPDLRMPPPDGGVPELTADQIEILRLWIERGAKYDKHWSFVPPRKPALPPVSDPGWVKNPIDRFVLAKLDASGLKPAPEADRGTLARRASLALTGLPPSPEELQAFQADAAPGAYERYVDRLIASPAYGEHQARFWLDAVRYGDTHGLHLDNERSIYPYRDWVIRAFNDDVPYNDFAVWQIAGDMLPKPTQDQLVATGYVRMNPTTNEGGAIEAEFLAKNTFDRVETTSTIFLGLTVGCARCHDHKYDPISHRDYFRLFAFFNSTADSPLDGNLLLPAPAIVAATTEQHRQLKFYERHLAEATSKVSLEDALSWLKAAWQPAVTTGNWRVSGPYRGGNFDEAFATAYPPEKGEGEWRPLDLRIGQAVSPVVGAENSAAYVSGTITAAGDRELGLRLSSDDGLRLWVNGELVHSNRVLRGLEPIDDVRIKLKAGENTLLFKVVNGGAGDGLTVRLGSAFDNRIEAQHQAWVQPGQQDRDPQALRQLYLEAGPENEQTKWYRSLAQRKTQFEAGLPQTLIARELEAPRKAHILRRGEYDQPQEEVDRGIPEIFGELPSTLSNDRLGLARWLVSDGNPLLARVTVNRIWQQHFGNGIVKTPEDFGAQGDWPANRPLLDYLAVTFREQGWSMKRLHRAIVTSASFRQASVVTPEKLEKDPENRLASRGPRYRLDAEVIRDAKLAASGLLNRRMGGRGFKPYQPDGIWEAIAFTDSTTARYVRDTGPDIYRRSLYLFWKRTAPHPVMMAFDAPMRESCVVGRSRTNTPLQALVTLNEPMMVESARVLGETLLAVPGSDRQRLEKLFLLTVSRKPTARESEILLSALDRHRTRFAADPKEALQLLSIGDTKRNEALDPASAAAWAVVCNTVMNTDEFLTMN
jgi:hypothetical protein